MLVNVKPQADFNLRFVIVQLNTSPTCSCTLCCSTAVFWWNLRYLIWSTCCSVLPESMMRKTFFFLFLCKLHAVTQLGSCFLCSAFLSIFCLSCPVLHFWWQAFFIFLWFLFFPSVQVDEKLLYFVYKKNLGKQAFVKLEKNKFVLFLLHPFCFLCFTSIQNGMNLLYPLGGHIEWVTWQQQKQVCSLEFTLWSTQLAHRPHINLLLVYKQLLEIFCSEKCS